ncbi:hypothetical protein RR46_03896 [Papilio xuthus]|uniref:Uncharacterized protein n=1 Tax=Papilio xuthus TaxID=66420 RepID=A0A194Q1V8_PAPXU|nr:hypothetical protein RR46_03896 [Papilio xuthus]
MVKCVEEVASAVAAVGGRRSARGETSRRTYDVRGVAMASVNTNCTGSRDDIGDTGMSDTADMTKVALETREFKYVQRRSGVARY